MVLNMPESAMGVVYKLRVSANVCPLGWALLHFCPGSILSLGLLAHFRLICQTVLIFLTIYHSQTELKQNWYELNNKPKVVLNNY